MRAVRIRLPKARCGEPDYEIVAVNGRRWQILRGVSVAVPEAVAEVLESARRARREAEQFEEARAR